MMGFASGLPLILVGSTLQAWYTTAGVNLMTIGLLGLVGFPYAWKFLWAPLLDHVHLPHLGRRRGWVFVCQISLVWMLCWMAFQQPAQHPGWLAVLALMAAFFSASQDTAIDAYRTHVLHPSEQGAGAAMYSLGYRLAMLMAGVVALTLAQWAGWHWTYLLMAAVMGGCAMATLSVPKVEEVSGERTLREAVVLPWVQFLKRPLAHVMLCFIVTYKLTDAFALALNSYFLLHVLHFSLIDLGEVTKVAGMVGVIAGSVLGGWLYPRLGLYRSLMLFGVLQASTALLFVWLTLVGKSYLLMTVTILAENFASGLSSVAFIVYLTSLCDQRYTAAQYALFSALASLPRILIGPVAAYCVKTLGWVDLYLIAFLVGFLPLAVLYKLHRRRSVSWEACVSAQRPLE